MRNNMKSTFQERRIQALEKRVQELESENKSLLQQCKRNEENISSKDAALNELKSSFEQNASEYYAGIKQVKELKIKYANAISNAQAIKEKYQKEMQRLIKLIKNSS